MIEFQIICWIILIGIVILQQVNINKLKIQLSDLQSENEDKSMIISALTVYADAEENTEPTETDTTSEHVVDHQAEIPTENQDIV